MLEEKQLAMKHMKEQHDTLKGEVSRLQATEVDLQHALEESERLLKDNQSKEKHWAKKLQGLKLHKIGANTEEKEGEAEAEDTALATLTPAQMAETDKEALQYDITVLEEKLNNMRPNLAAIKEYYRKENEYLSRVADLDQITEARDKLRAEYEDLRKQRLDTFMAGFGVITTKLKEMYQASACVWRFILNCIIHYITFHYVFPFPFLFIDYYIILLLLLLLILILILILIIIIIIIILFHPF